MKSLLVVALLGGMALAESQADIAVKINDQGVELMRKGSYADAASKFRDAASRDPQARYFFNLCTALYQQGVFGAALTSCNAVANNNPTKELQAKTDKAIATIKADAKAQHINLEPQPTENADKINQQGIDLMYAGKYAEATLKFRDAASRDPQPKYFFNLCTSLYQEGKFGEALTACGAVAHNTPTKDLQAKTDKLIVKIKDDAKAQHIELEPAKDDKPTRAAKLNDEGKDLMYAGKNADAVAKFEAAIAFDPLAKYYFNLCTADYTLGRFGAALTACEAVGKHDPTPEHQTKAIDLMVKIREEARKQKIKLD